MIHGTSQTWDPDFLEQFPEFSSDLSHVCPPLLSCCSHADCARRETNSWTLPEEKSFQGTGEQGSVSCICEKFQVFVVL